MILSRKNAEKLQRLVSGDFPELSKEIAKNIEDSNKCLRQIRSYQYCEHKWHIPTTLELQKVGSPEINCVEKWSKEELDQFYMLRASYCEKCGLEYKYQVLNDDDYNKIYDMYVNEPILTINAGHLYSELLISKYYEENI